MQRNTSHSKRHTEAACTAIAAALSVALLSSSANAQHYEREWRPNTLLGGGTQVHHGGYGGLLVRGSTLNSDPALFVGGRGGWLIGHQLLLGGAGMGQTLTVAAPQAAIQDDPEVRNLEFGYGGGWIAYHFLPRQVVHPIAGVLLGAGGLSFSNREIHAEMDQEAFTVNGIFVVEPELGVEINIVDFARFQASVSYRQVMGVDLPGLSNTDISGLSAGAALVFGRL